MLSTSPELLKHDQPSEKANQRVSTGPLWEGEESSYSNLVENASTHRGNVTHSWDNKYHRETHDPPANWVQCMDFFPIHCCHQADSFPKVNGSPSSCFRGSISESVCHVIQDVVYRTRGENGWGETLWGYKMHSLEGRLGALRHTICTVHRLQKASSWKLIHCFKLFLTI